jgi:hypothetical protein
VLVEVQAPLQLPQEVSERSLEYITVYTDRVHLYSASSATSRINSEYNGERVPETQERGHVASVEVIYI